MAKIHWIVYILAGFLFSSVSWKLNYEKLILFFYLGLLFILIGIGKLIFGSKENKEEKKKPILQKMQHKALQAMRQQFKRCAKCGNTARVNDNFCSRCGARI